MSYPLLTVEQVSDELGLHPKTVLRYIREGRLAATRVGKAYRVVRADLEAFAGLTNVKADTSPAARSTCITEVSGIAVDAAERIASFLQAAALSRAPQENAVHIQTVFDPASQTLKIVTIGIPTDVSKLLELLHLHLGPRP